jgi:FLYWCH zinc finger domain
MDRTSPAKKTTLFYNGKQYTRSYQSSKKSSYRCNVYRRMKCSARLEVTSLNSAFNLIVDHTCDTSPLISIVADDTTSDRVDEPSGEQRSGPTTQLDVKEDMEKEIDILSIRHLNYVPNQIWEIIREEFYQGHTNTIVRGLTKEQVSRRVYRTRELHFGGDYVSRVEKPPLSLVVGSDSNFFQFHYSFYDKEQLHRVIGWANPALIRLLRYNQTSLFVDGTFKCVPSPFSSV